MIKTTFAAGHPPPWPIAVPKVNNNLPALTYTQVKELRALRDAGMQYPALVEKYGHPRKTLYRAINGRGAIYGMMI